MRFKTIILTLFFISVVRPSTDINILRSDHNQLNISIKVDLISEDDLKPIHILVGLPSNSLPNLIINKNDLKNADFTVQNNIEASVEWIQIQKFRGLWVGTLKITPGITDNKYYRSILIKMDLSTTLNSNYISTNDKILSSKIINWDVAKNWIQTKQRSLPKVKSLPDGEWIKFTVDEDNIYKITGNTLTGIFPNIENLDNRSLMLFTGVNQGRAQDQTPGVPSPTENLIEIPIKYVGSNDGTFSENDEILFYGRGPSGFDNDGTNVTYNQNLYFNENTYWLLIPSDQSLRGKRITSTSDTNTPSISIDYGIRHIHIENDVINPFGSGLGWAELVINNNSFIQKNVELNNIDDSAPIELEVGFLGGTSDSKMRPYPLNSLAISINQEQSDNIGSTVWSGLGNRSNNFTIPDNLVNDGTNNLYFTNVSNDGYSNPYFDYLSLSYGQTLNYDSDTFEFYSPIHSNTVEYTITSNDPISIWEITDNSNQSEITTSQTNDQYRFTSTAGANTYNRFVVFNPENASIINNLEYIGNKSFSEAANNSYQFDHVIISTADYSNVANELVNHRRNSIFIPLETIYDEFSGGNADPMAIRNFINWTQTNWQPRYPQEFFLIGDADYDYRNITGNSNTIVPTVEIGISNSYATDDWLATINGNIPEVALGRFPAQSVSEAENYIEKLIEFEQNPEFGLWRQRVTLVADDGARPEDSPSELQIGKSHTINSEILADIIPNAVEVSKLYMLEFPEESNTTSFGVAKPEATAELFDILEKGTAIINYIGHGSAHQWAQERLLYQDRGDLRSINTGMKLPIWIAGTCSWGHFDNIGNESFSEELIRQEMNGASAIITTSRPITVTSNQYYEERLFEEIFPNGGVSDQSIGIILQSIKTGNQEGQYFHLFGDPGMKLPIPSNAVEIKSVTPDTLKTLEEASFTAVQNSATDGGQGFTIITEEEREVTREYNYLSNTESLAYKLPGPTLFRGQLSYNDTSIVGQFRIPKDITPTSNSTALKIYTYTDDDDPIEALGILDNLNVIHGSDTNDELGPIITLQTESGRSLMPGDHILEDEKIFLRLTDPLGINLAGETGHDIVLFDHNQDSEELLTNDFIYDANSITTGTIPLNFDINEGDIHISVKAWDSANNLAENEFELTFIKDSKLKLFNVLNFPNPFSKSTQFTFELSESANIEITIYTLGGRKIMEIESEYFSTGFHTIYWNGRDAFGDKLANGVYLYKIKAKNDEESTTFIGRLAKYE